jgi:hypothetical protein
MRNDPKLLRLFRREALPLAVLCALALVVQLLAGSLAASAATGDNGLNALCIGGEATGGDARPAVDHGTGLCPCGPVCPHGPACLSLGCSGAAASPVARPMSSAVSFGIWRDPLAPRTGLASGTIRAPPVSIQLPF